MMATLFRRPRIVVIGSLLLGVFILAWISFQSSPGVLTVAFLDVGQGDGVFIEGPTGTQVLYDAGPPGGQPLASLARMMPLWDRTIDGIILSHPDQDHIGGFPEIFKRYDVGVAMEPGVESGNGVYGALEKAIDAEEAAHYDLRRGSVVDLGGGARMDVLFPDHDPSGMETNMASIVLILTYGKTRVLLSGDSPIAIEEYLAASYGSGLHADILKLGHHGSRTSSSAIFLSAVSPEVAVASVGKDNEYGHPHNEVLERLAALGIPLLRTDEEGTIVFESDGETFHRR